MKVVRLVLIMVVVLSAAMSVNAQMWNIQHVPANYIINPKFEIVGKNLAGQRLEDRLNDLLK